MRRIFLLVAMLLLTVPVMAGVTVTATPVSKYMDGQIQYIVRLSYGTDINVRAFALDINSDNGTTINLIHDYNVGDNNGYGIFPGKFRDIIDATDPNWANTGYNPVAPSGDPGATGTGLDTDKIIVELGSLYTSGNAPANAGTLFAFDVNSEGSTSCDVTIAANDLRGGIVGDDGEVVADNLPITIHLDFIEPVTVGWIKYGNNDWDYNVIVAWEANSVPVTSYKLERSVSPFTSWTNVYTGTNTGIVRWKKDVVPAAASYRYRVCATNAAGDGPWTTGTWNAVSTWETCFPSTDPNYNAWRTAGRPRPWCFKRQCHGDASGTSEGTTKVGLYWVGNPDLTILKAGWLTKEPPFGVGIDANNSLGADFTRSSEGTTKVGIYRVGNPDLTVLKAYFQVKEPTFGPGVPTTNCGGSL